MSTNRIVLSLTPEGIRQTDGTTDVTQPFAIFCETNILTDDTSDDQHERDAETIEIVTRTITDHLQSYTSYTFNSAILNEALQLSNEKLFHRNGADPQIGISCMIIASCTEGDKSILLISGVGHGRAYTSSNKLNNLIFFDPHHASQENHVHEGDTNARRGNCLFNTLGTAENIRIHSSKISTEPDQQFTIFGKNATLPSHSAHSFLENVEKGEQVSSHEELNDDTLIPLNKKRKRQRSLMITAAIAAAVCAILVISVTSSGTLTEKKLSTQNNHNIQGQPSPSSFIPGNSTTADERVLFHDDGSRENELFSEMVGEIALLTNKLEVQEELFAIKEQMILRGEDDVKTLKMLSSNQDKAVEELTEKLQQLSTEKNEELTSLQEKLKDRNDLLELQTMLHEKGDKEWEEKVNLSERENKEISVQFSSLAKLRSELNEERNLRKEKEKQFKELAHTLSTQRAMLKTIEESRTRLSLELNSIRQQYSELLREVMLSKNTTDVASTPTDNKTTHIIAISQEVSSQYHFVSRGETLSDISLEYYGTAHRWREIFEANYDVITNHNVIRPGLKLIIP